MGKEGGLENSGLHQTFHLGWLEGGEERLVEGGLKESKRAKWESRT